MGVIVGIDYSTFVIDVVLLDEDHDTADHHRRRLDTGPGDALQRIRRIRDALPARGIWRDRGALMVAIEKPMSREARGLDSMQIALGAIVDTLDPDMPLELVRADDWRKRCGLPIRAPREQHKANAARFARDHWTNAPITFASDDASDAFGIAWAARELYRAAA